MTQMMIFGILVLAGAGAGVLGYRILERLRWLMGKAQEILDLIDQLDSATNAIAARLDALLVKLNEGAATDGLTQAEAQEVADKLVAERDRLVAMGKDSKDPLPEA